jgi:hypothetical protein
MTSRDPATCPCVCSAAVARFGSCCQNRTHAPQVTTCTGCNNPSITASAQPSSVIGRMGEGAGAPPRPGWIAGRGGETALSGVSGALAVPVMLRHVPPRGEAHSDGETALLRLVEALVQRLLGVGQPP